MRSMNWGTTKTFFTAGTLAAALLAFAGGAADRVNAAGKHGAGGHHGAAAAIGKPGTASKVTRTIVVTMRDNFYEPESISVKPGETIRFKITNKGEFLHEFGLGTAAMHAAHQKEMLVMMEHGMIEADRINHERMKMDHGDGMKMSHDDPNSVLLEPGKSGEIIWTFNKRAKLEFACNIPGHYESGMMGEIKFR
ncbi:MAG: cupredoxin domain-containing protein [Alphaproteobacteria bacterium]|nr:cupredoxin domain-containing protein [Alphaproteobacteria bacterium]